MPRNTIASTYLADGFGERLREARDRAGLAQRQVAFPGCTAAYISRLEAGERIPSLQMVAELARRLDLDPHWLATGKSSTGLIATALNAGRDFQRIFDSIAADETDGTFRLHTDIDLANANVRFREALAHLPPYVIDEVYARDELRRLRAELADCRRRLSAVSEALT